MFHQDLKQLFHTSDPIPSNTRWSKHAMLACSTLRPLDSSSFMMFTRRPGRFSHSMWISNPSSVHATSIYSHRHHIFPSQYRDQQQRMNTGVIITVITQRKSLLHNCTTSQHQRAITKKEIKKPYRWLRVITLAVEACLWGGSEVRESVRRGLIAHVCARISVKLVMQIVHFSL